jgi:hypothetical protein
MRGIAKMLAWIGLGIVAWTLTIAAFVTIISDTNFLFILCVGLVVAGAGFAILEWDGD